jgi:hypothetical protein
MILHGNSPKDRSVTISLILPLFCHGAVHNIEALQRR